MCHHLSTAKIHTDLVAILTRKLEKIRNNQIENYPQNKEVKSTEKSHIYQERILSEIKKNKKVKK